ncbi:haloacid dehalogenase type II [Pseudonocardia adelaidensis]|uniref:Haloacid dehalogenase type II n=1 Tax=Pseudonocardia adelaidensis TaxID=648754 RepID=A0ABP9NE05_9PSEU
MLAFDVFGTSVDWWTGITCQVTGIAAARGIDVDAAALAGAWRDRYLPSMARVRTGERPWTPLDTLHRESLDDVLDELGLADRFAEAVREQLVRCWYRLPAWDDVAGGLDRLRGRYLVVALSNGGFALLTHLAKHAGLRFDAVLSAELARTYKPDPAVYRTAAGLLGVEPARMLLVACHGWDITGAANAGLRTAFLERPGEKGPDHTADRAVDTSADLVVRGVGELAAALGC